MKKDSYCTPKNHFHDFHLTFGFWLSIMILISGFSTTSVGQIAIPISQLNPEFSKSNNDRVKAILPSGSDLLVLTNQGVWILSGDGKKATEVAKISESIEGPPNEFALLGDTLFVSTREGLWLHNKESNKLTKVQIPDYVRKLKVMGGRLLVDTYGVAGKTLYEQIYIFNERGALIEKLENAAFYEEKPGLAKEDLVVMLGNDTVYYPEGGKPIVIDPFFSEIISTIRDDNYLFITTDYSLYVFNKDGKRLNKDGVVKGGSKMVTLGDHLFVCDDEDLWKMNRNSLQATKIEVVNEGVRIIESFRGQLFIGTTSGLWVADKEGGLIKKIEGIKGNISRLEASNNILFAGTDSDVFIIHEGGERSNKIGSVQGGFENIRTVGEFIYFVSNEKLYQLNPEVTIETTLNPRSRGAAFINNFLPPNWIPIGEIEAKADYYENNKTSTINISGEFRFARAEDDSIDDSIPSDGQFSTQAEFGYPIVWGGNEIQYWVRDKWGNTFKSKKFTYYGVPSQYFFAAFPFVLSVSLILVCFILAPKVAFCHSAIMNPVLRKYFSLGIIPLLLSVFPPLRRHILQRYSNSINKDNEFTEWKTRFVCPDEEFLPEKFGEKINDVRRLLLTGQSGIGKTSFFKYLTACYVSADKPSLPARVFPVYISLTNYGGTSLEEMVFTQLYSRGEITDPELTPMFLQNNILLIFFDGVNEVQNIDDRKKLRNFVEKYWTSNYICLSSQQGYFELDNIPAVELKTFGPEKVREFITNRTEDSEKAKKVIEGLTAEDYKLYSIPRDLEFGVEIINGTEEFLPKSRTELYKAVFDSIFAQWKEMGNSDLQDDLCKRAYEMIAKRELAFDSVDDPTFEYITRDLYKEKFLVRREHTYNFRHDLIRSFLASEYFYPRWPNLLEMLDGKPIDSNWLEMLKFACENIENPAEVKNLIYAVMQKSIKKDLVKNLFEWLKTNHPDKCKLWEKDFYAKYGELDFK